MKNTFLFKDNKRFFSIAAVVIVVVFLLNINHIHQQLVYDNNYQVIAENLLSGNGYTFELFEGKPAFYPMWGYSFIVLIDTVLFNTTFFVLLIQAALCFWGVIYFYRIFDLKPAYYHLALMLPFFALMSVKWPDAFVSFLLLPYLYHSMKFFKSNKISNLFPALIFFGILLNFRTEYLMLPIAQIMMSVLWHYRGMRKINLYFSLVVFGFALLALLPWAVRSYNHTGKLQFTSSNGGMVAYVGLGNLPDNPWGAYLAEQASYDLIAEYGIKNPYSEEGNRILLDTFFNAVKDQPWLYMKKNLINVKHSLTGGIYTGEFANIFVTPDRRSEINEELKKINGRLNQLNALTKYKASESIPIIVEKVIQAAFIPVFFILSLSVLYVFFRYGRTGDGFFIATVCVIIFYKFIVVILLLYESRFLSPVYLLMLGLTLKYLLPALKKSRK